MYRAGLLPDEVYAVRHALAFLSRYPLFVALPRALNAPLAQFTPVHFEDSYFDGIAGYNRLMLSTAFYERFARFRYILIYQLDALVFADRLLEFCAQGWDYIGAPWLKSPKDARDGFVQGGNGGLSLRHVPAFLDVLNNTRLEGMPMLQRLAVLTTAPMHDLQTEPLPLRWLKQANVVRHARHGLKRYLASYPWNEDRFWSNRARLFKADFRVAPPPVALDFAFEEHPRTCLEINGGRLPFGCHAWARYDRDFWQPYLLES
jgi:hypothetical protein